jgi:phenol hydroxylase P4 protein
MTTTAITPDYHGTLKDTVDHFHGNQILNIGWDQHLMFATPMCIPVPAGMPFGALVQQVLPSLFGQHPQFAQIDWERTQWLRSGEPFAPDMAKSLADNGLGHKAMLRFKTPDQTGLAGVAI